MARTTRTVGTRFVPRNFENKPALSLSFPPPTHLSLFRYGRRQAHIRVAPVRPQLIHFVFVPVILLSVAVWLAYTPAIVLTPPVPRGQPHDMPLNGAFFLVLVPYALFYLLLDPFAGASWSVCVGLPVWLGASALRQAYPSHAWLWAVYAHLFSWFVQIVPGHGYFEKRKPSLMDSFVQSLLLAPLFVWFELLFALGYRPELHADVSASARKSIASAREAERRLLDQDDDGAD